MVGYCFVDHHVQDAQLVLKRLVPPYRILLGSDVATQQVQKIVVIKSRIFVLIHAENTENRGGIEARCDLGVFQQAFSSIDAPSST